MAEGASAQAREDDPARSRLPSPYLLFLGDATEPAFAKTAFGLRDWIPERCVGEWACAEATVTTGLPRLGPAEALAHSPTQRSGIQSRRPNAVLANAGSVASPRNSR